jgi:glucan phosphorylase
MKNWLFVLKKMSKPGVGQRKADCLHFEDSRRSRAFFHDVRRACQAHSRVEQKQEEKRRFANVEQNRYKRQLLNILYTIYSYTQIKAMSPEERKAKVVPRCVMFGGKVSVFVCLF